MKKVSKIEINCKLKEKLNDTLKRQGNGNLLFSDRFGFDENILKRVSFKMIASMT